MIPRLPLKIKILPVFLSLVMQASTQIIIPTHADLYTEAEEYMLAGEYKEALPLYLDLYDKGYATANLNFKIGECYLNLPGQKDKAVPYLEKACSKISAAYTGTDLNEENAPLVAYLYLGIAYRLGYDFNKAGESFMTMLSKVDTADHQTRILLEYHINRCHNAEELIHSPAIVNRKVLPGNINTAYSNSNALVLADEKTMFYMNELKFYDAVMQAVKTGEGWQEPTNITPMIKSDGDHFITGISADGTTLFLTFYDPYNSGEIFSSHLVNDKWTPVTKLNNNINTVFNETHASLSADGKTLYFTSDRKGGYGGLDLYKSEFIQDEWGPAKNLGPAINTIFDEETPFLTPDGKKLFFSSQGHYNMGGFDIFCSENNHGNWLPPANIGFPVNTTDDDLFFYPVDTGSVAYMALRDKGAGESDIYRFELSQFANPSRYKLMGQVTPDSGESKDIDKIKVVFIEKENMDTIASQHLDKEGKFNQKLTCGNFDLFFTNNEGDLIDRKELAIPPNFPQDQLVFNTQISLPVKVKADTFRLENILFAFDNSTIPPQSEKYLNSLIDMMLRYPDTRLEVTGFTDAIGKQDYNMKLSYRRAMSVTDFIIRQNINPSRVITKGLGESRPVALNCNADGTDNPEGRKFNRRAEIEIFMLPDHWVLIKKDEVPDYLKSK
ncbi:MAG: PD40 domain-containing protein [Bacteroidales bacterium]|nr:PD40 domain-containing protein [Bacteroidales bacterium]MBN2764191.1 PD40 domain-containing protein [Bacteroidales bacterium]